MDTPPLPKVHIFSGSLHYSNNAGNMEWSLSRSDMAAATGSQ